MNTPPDILQEITGIASGQAQLGGLALVRIVAMVGLMPVLGSNSVPRTARIGLALAFTACIFPTLTPHTAKLPGDLFGYAGLALRELAVGLLAGWAFSMVFQVMEIAGAMIDLQAGFSMVELFDPTTGESTHLFGQFLGICATVSFMAGGGFSHLVGALAESFRTIPLAQVHLDAATTVPVAISMTGNAFYLGLQMAGPVLMALLMLSIVMAIVSRIMPGMNTWILAMPLQVVTACLVTAVSLPTIMGAFHGWEDQVVRTASTMLRGG